MYEDAQFLTDMGERISKRRKELNLTQEQLAESINLSLQSISCIELGKKAIRPQNLVNLCTALGVTTDYILTGKKEIKQLEGIFAILNESDYTMVENLVNHLYKNKKWHQGNGAIFFYKQIQKQQNWIGSKKFIKTSKNGYAVISCISFFIISAKYHT